MVIESNNDSDVYLRIVGNQQTGYIRNITLFQLKRKQRTYRPRSDGWAVRAFAVLAEDENAGNWISVTAIAKILVPGARGADLASAVARVSSGLLSYLTRPALLEKRGGSRKGDPSEYRIGIRIVWELSVKGE